VVLDDEEMEWGGPGSEGKGADMTVVVVRRKGLGIYRLGNRMVPIKVRTMYPSVNPSSLATRKYHYLPRRHTTPCSPTICVQPSRTTTLSTTPSLTFQTPRSPRCCRCLRSTRAC
jgi:hypothetical protein